MYCTGISFHGLIDRYWDILGVSLGQTWTFSTDPSGFGDRTNDPGGSSFKLHPFLHPPHLGKFQGRTYPGVSRLNSQMDSGVICCYCFTVLHVLCRQASFTCFCFMFGHNMFLCIQINSWILHDYWLYNVLVIIYLHIIYPGSQPPFKKWWFLLDYDKPLLKQWWFRNQPDYKMVVRSPGHVSKKITTHPLGQLWKESHYSLLVKVARGVFQRCVETTLECLLISPWFHHQGRESWTPSTDRCGGVMWMGEIDMSDINTLPETNIAPENRWLEY